MDIKQTELGLLLALHALLDHENVSLAANQIGITQPAMSAQLKRSATFSTIHFSCRLAGAWLRPRAPAHCKMTCASIFRA